jgi:hypothetical protein
MAETPRIEGRTDGPSYEAIVDALRLLLQKQAEKEAKEEAA